VLGVCVCRCLFWPVCFCVFATSPTASPDNQAPPPVAAIHDHVPGIAYGDADILCLACMSCVTDSAAIKANEDLWESLCSEFSTHFSSTCMRERCVRGLGFPTLYAPSAVLPYPVLSRLVLFRCVLQVCRWQISRALRVVAPPPRPSTWAPQLDPPAPSVSGFPRPRLEARCRLPRSLCTPRLRCVPCVGFWVTALSPAPPPCCLGVVVYLGRMWCLRSFVPVCVVL
jgi:hypothetical protein